MIETTDGVPYLGGPECGHTHHIPPGHAYPPTVIRTIDHGTHPRTYHYELARYVRRCREHHPQPCPSGPPRVVHVYRLVREATP